MDFIFDLIAEGLFSVSEEALKDKSASKIKKRAAAVFLLTVLLAVTGLLYAVIYIMFGSEASPQLAAGKFHSFEERTSLPSGNLSLAQQEFHCEPLARQTSIYQFDLPKKSFIICVDSSSKLTRLSARFLYFSSRLSYSFKSLVMSTTPISLP